MLFCFNDTATPEIYTLSLHDALPIFSLVEDRRIGGIEILGLSLAEDPATPLPRPAALPDPRPARPRGRLRDRKSTRLNSSHRTISYAVFCLKKKKKTMAQHKLQLLIH